MSIYVYVTRHENPIEDGPSISEAEWLAVAPADPSFRSASEVGIGRPSASSYFIWTGRPEGVEAWFIWTDGQIDLKTPDEPMIAKAMELASKLDARVISEMGEVFNDDGTHKGFVDGAPW